MDNIILAGTAIQFCVLAVHTGFQIVHAGTAIQVGVTAAVIHQYVVAITTV